jgi:hypothetical protein
MTRAEAYWILHKMMVETFSADQSEALSIALDDIQFVDLMPDDLRDVTRCHNCHSCTSVDGVFGKTLYCTEWERNTEANGFCYKGW